MLELELDGSSIAIMMIAAVAWCVHCSVTFHVPKALVVHGLCPNSHAAGLLPCLCGSVPRPTCVSGSAGGLI